MKQHVTATLSIGSVIVKDEVTFYVIGKGQASYTANGMTTLIDSYSIASSRVSSFSAQYTALNMDGRGWKVVGRLTDSGYIKACKNSVAVDTCDWEGLEYHLLYDSKLTEKVQRIQKLQMENCEDDTIYDMYQEVVDIMCM